VGDSIESSGYRRTRKSLRWRREDLHTRRDDGTTGLYFGGRASKSSDQIEVNGEVDEAQSTLGWPVR